MQYHQLVEMVKGCVLAINYYQAQKGIHLKAFPQRNEWQMKFFA